MHVAIALLPLALYLIWQGVRGLSRRPRLIPGTWNTLGMSWALLGLLMVGPLPLVLPDHAIQRFQMWIWVLLLTLYALVAILIVLLSRPHAYLQNISRETLRPLIAEITRRMDPQCTWAGDSAALPQAGLEFRMETQPFFKVVHLQTLGPQVSLAAWEYLMTELRTSLKNVKTGPRPGASASWRSVCRCSPGSPTRRKNSGTRRSCNSPPSSNTASRGSSANCWRCKWNRYVERNIEAGIILSRRRAPQSSWSARPSSWEAPGDTPSSSHVRNRILVSSGVALFT
ncbi:MAG: hypothetical protein QM811_26475 [Pirellulales bacterium]